MRSPISLRPFLTENGFYVNRRFMWMGRWIRRGYYPSWILRLFRHGKGRCENRAINEQLFVEGATGYLSNDLIHEDRRGIGDWIAKHNRYASREALELARTEQERRSNELDARLMGSQAERKRWIRRHVWNRLPPLVRPVGVLLSIATCCDSVFSTASRFHLSLPTGALVSDAHRHQVPRTSRARTPIAGSAHKPGQQTPRGMNRLARCSGDLLVATKA